MENLPSSARLAFQLAKVGRWSFDPYTMQGCWDEEAAAMHGLPAGPVPPLEQYVSLFENLSFGMLQQHIKQAVETNKPFEFEAKLKTANDQEKWVRWIGQPVAEQGRAALNPQTIRGGLDPVRRGASAPNPPARGGS